MSRENLGVLNNLSTKILNIFNGVRNREDITKLCVDNLGERTIGILKCIVPINIGFVFSILIKKMLKATLIFLGTSSIVYIFMVSYRIISREKTFNLT